MRLRLRLAQTPASLAGGKMGAPVHLPARFLGFRALRQFLTETDHAKTLDRNSRTFQIILDGQRSPVAQPDVVLRRPSFIAMPFNPYEAIWEIAQNTLQHGCVPA